MKQPEDLLRVLKDTPEYLEMAARESEFWANVHPFGIEALEQKHETGPVEQHTNRRFTGDENVSWEKTTALRGTFRRGLALGTSLLTEEASILETNPHLHLTFVDISEGPLLRRREILEQRFPGRVAIQVADLNFLELPSEGYDFISSSSTIHHVTNLEYLAYQINRGLTADGHFFLYDYVGEPRFNFSEDKRRLYTEIFHRDTERQGRGRPELTWLDSSDLSPFCGVRSDEILPTMRSFLDEIQLRTSDTLTTLLNRSRPVQDVADSPWVSDDWLHRMGRWRLLVAHLRKLYPAPARQNAVTPGIPRPAALERAFPGRRRRGRRTPGPTESGVRHL